MAIILPTNKYGVYDSFKLVPKTGGRSKYRRSSEYEHEVEKSDKIQAGIGSVAGTLLALAILAKKQNIKNPFKLNYGLTEMITISALSVAGGVSVGMIGDSKEARKNKFKEGVFQFMNGSIPTWIVSGVLKLSELSEHFNNVPSKIGSVILALAVGMYGTATVSNLLFDPLDKKPDRKLTLKDCLANIDDAIGVFVMAKIPIIEKLKIDKILPAIFAYSGYRAGKSN
ncbi:hypothetical protein J6G99_09120 [bacterium]|nr:hypothetical protein [bacterium]